MTTTEQIRQLVAEFAHSVIQQTNAIGRGDARTGNEFAERYIAAFRELRGFGDVGRDALVPLLTHPRADVRVGTAAYLLRYKTEEALKVLRTEAATEEGLASFEASEAIVRWEEGDWHLDPAED